MSTPIRIRCKGIKQIRKILTKLTELGYSTDWFIQNLDYVSTCTSLSLDDDNEVIGEVCWCNTKVCTPRCSAWESCKKFLWLEFDELHKIPKVGEEMELTILDEVKYDTTKTNSL